MKGCADKLCDRIIQAGLSDLAHTKAYAENTQSLSSSPTCTNVSTDIQTHTPCSLGLEIVLETLKL